MGFSYEERQTDSSYIVGIARVFAETDITPLCRADGRWELIVRRQQGRNNLLVGGPMTKASLVSNGEGSEFLIIKFKFGLYMPALPARNFVDAETALPEASSKSVWLNGSAWPLFDYENVETFIDRLVREDALVWDPVVKAALDDQPQIVPDRTQRHRFLRVTGLTQRTIRRIERARQAAALLESGVPILDTVYQAGYADQPHLTRALKHFIGQTPAQLLPPKPA
jgi:hypothetical protein